MTDWERRIQSCVDHINTAVDVDPWAKELVAEMGKEILKAQLTEKDTTSDCISRRGAIDICNNVIDLWQGQLGEGALVAIKNAINNLPSAQPKLCEDAVSREAVSKWLKQYGQDVLHGKYKFSLMYIWKNLMDLPSVQPTYTDAEIQKMQDMEAAEIKKAFDLGREDAQSEIVRCKDCKHGAPSGKYGCKLYHYRLYETHEMKPDDFCSRSERRTDG